MLTFLGFLGGVFLYLGALGCYKAGHEAGFQRAIELMKKFAKQRNINLDK